MNRRLQTFLEVENLSPAQLADRLGVQRSGISHILSGRNKPGFDFIAKLVTQFPEINTDWLLTGLGKPLKDQTLGTEALSSPAKPTGNSNYGRSKSFNSASNSNSGTSQIGEFASSLNQSPTPSSQLNGELNNFSSGSHQMENRGNFETENRDEGNLFGLLNGWENEETPYQNPQKTDSQQFAPNYSVSQAPQNRNFDSAPALSAEKRVLKKVILIYSDGSFEELSSSNRR